MNIFQKIYKSLKTLVSQHKEEITQKSEALEDLFKTGDSAKFLRRLSYSDKDWESLQKLTEEHAKDRGLKPDQNGEYSMIDVRNTLADVGYEIGRKEREMKKNQATEKTDNNPSTKITSGEVNTDIVKPKIQR